MIETLFFLFLPPSFTALAGSLLQSALRQPNRIAWWRLITGTLIFALMCLYLEELASAGGLGGTVALTAAIFATLPILISAVWILWSAPRWRKLVAPALVLLFPGAFWFSIQQGDAQSPESITQHHGDQIVQALEQYRSTQQRYPSALATLVPNYISSLPDALTTQGTGWLYHTDGRQYTLGYWHYPDRDAVMLCRYHSIHPEWQCKATPNNQYG
jgi:hypothetical protein